MALAAVLAAALLTACAGAAGTAETDSGGTSHVTIGKAVDTIGFTTVDVARAKGYYAKKGVRTKEELLGGSSTAFAALQSGSVQFVAASSTALLSAKAKGVPLQAVASLDHGISLQLVASHRWIKKRHLSPKQPVKKVLRGLSGATLGAVSTTDVTHYNYLMKMAGVPSDKFKIITIKTHSAMLAALQHGQIDAFLLSPPNSFHAEEQGHARIVASLRSVPALRRMTYDVLVAAKPYAEKNPDVVRAVATGTARADNLMAQRPRAVLDVEQQHYPKMSEKVLLQSLEHVTFAPDGKMSKRRWQDASKMAEETDVPEVSSVDLEPGGDTWTNEYIDADELSSGSGKR